MKAVVITRYGGPEVLEIQDVSKPQPGPNEVLVHVRSTALKIQDAHRRLESNETFGKVVLTIS
jgi:NADPH:quinone reductase